MPLYSHPITCQHVGEKLWTHRRMKLSEPESAGDPPPGFVTHDQLGATTGLNLVSCSDGSVHYHEQVAAAAWIITADEDHHMGACFLMADVNHVTAYRSELEGIFRTLSQLDYLNMTPSDVLHWCDNEQSVASTAKPPSYAGGMLDADAHLVLAIHTLKSKLPFPVDCRHVYGHQDDKKKRKKMKEMEKAKRKLKEMEKAKSARQRQHTQSSPQPHHLQPSTSSSFDSSDESVTSAEESIIDLFCLRPQTSTNSPSDDEKASGKAQARKERPK